MLETCKRFDRIIFPLGSSFVSLGEPLALDRDVLIGGGGGGGTNEIGTLLDCAVTRRHKRPSMTTSNGVCDTGKSFSSGITTATAI